MGAGEDTGCHARTMAHSTHGKLQPPLTAVLLPSRQNVAPFAANSSTTVVTSSDKKARPHLRTQDIVTRQLRPRAENESAERIRFAALRAARVVELLNGPSTVAHTVPAQALFPPKRTLVRHKNLPGFGFQPVLSVWGFVCHEWVYVGTPRS